MTTYSYDNILGDYSSKPDDVARKERAVGQILYEPEPGVQLCMSLYANPFVSDHSGSSVNHYSTEQSSSGNLAFVHSSTMRQRQQGVMNVRAVGDLRNKAAARNMHYAQLLQNRSALHLQQQQDQTDSSKNTDN